MNESSLTFVGTATLIIRLGSFTLLTDPNFLHQGQRAYLGKGFVVQEAHRAGRQPYQLPDLGSRPCCHTCTATISTESPDGTSPDLMPVMTTPTRPGGSAGGASTPGDCGPGTWRR